MCDPSPALPHTLTLADEVVDECLAVCMGEKLTGHTRPLILLIFQGAPHDTRPNIVPLMPTPCL